MRGIPTLIVLGEDGAVITAEGREEVNDDPEGRNFPWRPKALSEILGSDFITKEGMRGKDVIQGKTLALYFSAHW